MTFVYCDAALANEQGHFATFCRHFTGELRRLTSDLLVLGHARIEPELAAALGATPFFRFHPNASTCDDPLCGPLTDFIQAARITAEDFSRLAGFTADNIVFYEHAKQAQLMALIDWAQARFSPETCPLIVVTFGWPGGVERGVATDGRAAWRITDQRMAFYRHASRMLTPAFAPRFRFAAYDPSVAAAYQFLLGRPVRVFPAPLGPTRPSRDRSATLRPTIAFLGEQRLEKGLARIPGIVRELLARHDSIRILVHNSWQEPRPENAALQALAAADSRLEVVLGATPAARWDQMLEATDLLVLPYESSVYATAISGTAIEATACGIPLVAPQGTTMERLMQGYGMPGVVCPTSAPPDVVAAVGEVLANYPAFAQRAAAAGRRWQETAGAGQLVRAILACRDQPGAIANRRQSGD
ncbi:MAG: hypothetical protein RLZZ440_1014 [Planctomycetota bacterium]